MAAPALQKTWQGGSTAGGTQFVNVIVTGTTPRDTLWAIKNAMVNFFAVPWTVIGSSDGVNASMDGTDRWIDSGDIIFRTTGGTPVSWIVLQQTGIGATFQVLLYINDLLSQDPNRENITIIANAGGFGTANGGSTDGDTINLPTPSDTSKNFGVDGTGWMGAEGVTPTQMILTCISSTDGQCTRIIASKQSTGIPVAALGFEVPRLPPATWTAPALMYLFKSTVASGLSCFRWETMADAITNAEMVANVDRDDATGFTSITMLPMMPMFSTVEVIDSQEDDRPNPMLYPPTLFGYDVAEPAATPRVHGTMFDWYWCNRNVAGKHLLDLDTVPAAASPATAASFPNDTTSPNSMALVASPASGMRISGDISIELWVHPLGWAGPGNRQPVVKRNNGSSVNYGLGVVAPGTQVEFQYGTTGGGTTRFQDRPASVPVSTWTHLAATRDKATGTTKLFVNGVQAGADLVQDAGSFNDLVTGTAYIGGTTSAITDFYGYACEYRLWNIIRTPAEILANYNQELVGNEAGLVCYLPLVTDFLDATANSNDFTPTAGAGQPAPSIEAIARPFGLAAVPPRAFVCVGDCVYGWLNDSATDLSYT